MSNTKQIEALRDEAVAAGDLVQVAVCDAALGGDGFAQAECWRVISEAAARADERAMD